MRQVRLQASTLKHCLQWGWPCTQIKGVTCSIKWQQGFWFATLSFPYQIPYGFTAYPHPSGAYLSSIYMRQVTLRSGTQCVPQWEGILHWDGHWEPIDPVRETIY